MRRFCFVSALLMTLSTSPLLAQDLVTTYEGPLGHTVAMNVASFTDVRDKTLEDVLKKMPGLEVSDSNGSLTYNQMDVTKIFINGNDSRSSLKLVSGLKPEDIEKVEFVDNFQSVLVLRGKQYSADVAMNIVMKDPDSSRWTGSARGGLGATPLLYEADAYAMRLGKNGTNMVNVKANNTGEDLSSSITSFQADNIGLTVNYFSLSNYISISPTTTDLSTKRSRFNDSFMFNTVNTVKLNDKFQFYGQLSYAYDKYNMENTTNTTYYMQDGSAVTETAGEYANRKTNQAKTNLVLIANTDKYYLANHIYANASWQDVDMNLTGTYPNQQGGKLTSITAKDDFRYLKPIGDWTLTVFSQNQFSGIPQNIQVTRDGSSQHQEIKSHALFSDTNVSFGYTKNNWTVSLVGGLDALTRTLKTNLNGVVIEDQPDFVTVDNNSHFSYLEGFVQPTVNYVTSKFQMKVGIPVRYFHYSFNERMRDEQSSHNLTNFEPLFSLKYNFSPNFSLRLDGSQTYDQVDAGNFYTGMILTNYRYMKTGALNYKLNNTRKLELGYDFKQPAQSAFVSGAITYTDAKSMYRNYDQFIGDFVLRGTTPQDTDTKTLNAYIVGVKGISALKGNVRLWLGGTHYDLEMIRNNVNVKYKVNALAFQPSINGRLTSWMKVEYLFRYVHNTMKVLDTTSKTLTYNQGLELTFNPSKKFNISILGEHYHASGSGMEARNLFLADAKAEYQLTSRLQLIAHMTNILNQTEYTYTAISNDDLTSTSQIFKLRPRNTVFSLYYKF